MVRPRSKHLVTCGGIVLLACKARHHFVPACEGSSHLFAVCVAFRVAHVLAGGWSLCFLRFGKRRRYRLERHCSLVSVPLIAEQDHKTPASLSPDGVVAIPPWSMKFIDQGDLFL